MSTVKAFRTILRAKYPERKDLLQIDSYQWFYDRQQIEINDQASNPFDGVLIAPTDDQPAYEALSVLRDGVASGLIRLRGISDTKQTADIDPIHAQQGNLDVFAGTLTFEHSDVFRTKEKYTSVYVYADDLAKIVERPAPKGKGGRPPKYDRAAVAAEVQSLMDHHGEFSDDDPDWNAQARLCDAIRGKFGEASDSTIEDYIKDPLARWRKQHPKT
jgi:hypothetical protein